jgi:hypothetical protein
VSELYVHELTASLVTSKRKESWLMLFRPYLVEAILNGTKTQTRRLRKPGDTVVHRRGTIPVAVYRRPVYTRSRPENVIGSRLLWRVHKTYAVQPGRGKRAVARIQIAAIREERLQYISLADAVAEGIVAPLSDYDPVSLFIRLWNDINVDLGTRWEDNPEVWVLTFHLVQDTS